MNLTIEIRLDPQTVALIEKLIEAIRDLITVAEPFTGWHLVPDKED